MKNIVFIFAFILISVINSIAQYIPVPVGSSSSLNGTWKFIPSPAVKIFESSEYHFGWKDINVPGKWTMQGFLVKKGERAAYQAKDFS